MSVLSSTTKARVGVKAAKGVVKHPGVVRVGAKASMPAARVGASLAKRRARRRVSRIGEAMRDAGETLVTYGPQAARNLGLVEAPKPKRTAPRLAAGVVIGAGAMYLLDPEHGKEHREKVAHLVG
jgi:hypothetical protein